MNWTEKRQQGIVWNMEEVFTEEELGISLSFFDQVSK